MFSNFGEVIFEAPVRAPPGWPESDWHYDSFRTDFAGLGNDWAIRNPGDRVGWLAGFGYVYQIEPPGYFVASRCVCVPHWFLALLFAVLPAVRILLILRTRRRHRAGICPNCGYDLRATI